MVLNQNTRSIKAAVALCLRTLNGLVIISMLLAASGPLAPTASADASSAPAVQVDPTATPTASLEPSPSATELPATESATLTPALPATETAPATETTSPSPSASPTGVESPTTTPSASPSASPTVTATTRSTSTATLTPTVPATATATQTPETGGEEVVDVDPDRDSVLTSSDGRVQVLFPAGAVSEPVRASYRSVLPPEVPQRDAANLIFAFELEAYALSDSDARQERFDRYVHLKIDLTDIVTATLPRGQELWLGYYDPQSESWVRVPFSVTTGAQGDEVFVEADIEHFSTWAPGYSVSPGWIPTFNEPQVDTFSGSANFSFPLEVPPGRGGIQPSLVLN